MIDSIWWACVIKVCTWFFKKSLSLQKKSRFKPGDTLYNCLSGLPPFSEENGPHSLKEQIEMGKLEFSSPYWDNVSTEGEVYKSICTV